MLVSLACLASVALLAADESRAVAHRSQGIEVRGQYRGDRLGVSVGGGGDFDGDGAYDAVIGAPGADTAHGRDAGVVCLLLYSEGFSSHANLFAVKTLKIFGANAGDRLGAAVAAAGDFNGDGYEDVIVGAPGADPEGRVSAGAAYLIYGNLRLKDSSLAKDFEGLPIYGAESGGRLGRSVAGAGDFNGDGIDDVILGAPEAGSLDRSSAGAAYVVFGRRSDAAIDLATDPNTMVLRGPSSHSSAGQSVAGTRDVNHDGFDDIVIGAPGYHANGGFSGAAYVVWGSSRGGMLDLGLVGTPLDVGFAIFGAAEGDDAGWAVSSAGDADGDGTPDVAVGARGVDVADVRNAGAAYVVMGQETRTSIQLDDLDGGGYRIVGSHTFDLTGAAVAEAGDVNDDGYDDLVVGAPRASRTKLNQGVVYVVGGREPNGVVDAASESLHWFLGTRRLERFGTSVAGAGDFNGDGVRDILSGAPHRMVGNVARVGRADLVMLGRLE